MNDIYYMARKYEPFTPAYAGRDWRKGVEFKGHEEAIAVLERAKAELEKLGFCVRLQTTEKKLATVKTEGKLNLAEDYHNIVFELNAEKDIFPNGSGDTGK